jgi:hypothetical protein
VTAGLEDQRFQLLKALKAAAISDPALRPLVQRMRRLWAVAFCALEEDNLRMSRRQEINPPAKSSPPEANVYKTKQLPAAADSASSLLPTAGLACAHKAEPVVSKLPGADAHSASGHLTDAEYSKLGPRQLDELGDDE